VPSLLQAEQSENKMKLDEFRKMWEKDGFHFSKSREEKVGSRTLIMYSLTLPYYSAGYGRHYALIVVVDQKKEVIAWDDNNTRFGNISQIHEAWFESTKAEALVLC